MNNYIPLNLTKKELNALLMAINHHIISDLDDHPDALLYWDNDHSFYMDEGYFHRFVSTISSRLQFADIPAHLKIDLEAVLKNFKSQYYHGRIAPSDISNLRQDMEDYHTWRTKYYMRFA
ncbi:MAG: hypothetical protein WCH29_03860 [Chitinophagaceae bacterium]